MIPNEWPTDLTRILQRVDAFDPTTYTHTRNFKDGNLSRLSPYLSRGIFSTRYLHQIITENYPKEATAKFIQELLWRDYFQRLLQSRPELYHQPLRLSDTEILTDGVPQAVLGAATGIIEIDQAVEKLYNTGYMHNHFRLYVASICCNIAQSSFASCAKWMYYHLLDGDIASNYGSWQWVAGTLTGKKYYANQDNINFYSRTLQQGTFLDKVYEELADGNVPHILQKHCNPPLMTKLPQTPMPQLLTDKVLLYNLYNLDPFWHRGEDLNRVLILEPSHFEKFPVSEKVLGFCLQLANNIPKLIIYTGEFEELKARHPEKEFVSKEHPLLFYEGATIEERDWIVPEVTGFYGSFSKYYQQCQKYL